MAIDRKYLNDAMEMLGGSFEAQKTQYQNSFNQNIQSLEGQKGGVNQNFDNQLEQNSRNTTRSKNQYNNNTLSRGLGRSTIATSGMAGIQDQGNRISNEVNEQRTAALGNIEAQKALLQQSLQESLLGLQAQQDSEALSLAQQLEQQAYDRAFQREQFDWQKAQAGRSSSGGYSSRRSGGSGSGSSGSNFDSTKAWRYFDQLLADDMKNGTYEAGRYASQVSSLSPSDSAAMMRAYEESRKKSGSRSQQTSSSGDRRRTNNSY